MLDLPVWYEPWEIGWSYMQLKHFVFSNWHDLKHGDYPMRPTYGYQQWNESLKIWQQYSAQSYIGGGKRVNTTGRHVKCGDITAEIDYRIESIKRYPLQLDGYSVTVNGDLVLDAFTESLPLNADLLHEAHLMLEFISGWDRRKNFKEFRERIRRE